MKITITGTRHITEDTHPNLYAYMVSLGWRPLEYDAVGTRGASYIIMETTEGRRYVLNSKGKRVENCEVDDTNI